ncbi:MAG: serine/threonine protein kinase [Candidatus Brocadiae bacterium]|nr:serine/threonine protein kinase [Candidatus Brocadiia bacterium]
MPINPDVEAIPGYLIDRKLSTGGTAGVYRALDIGAGKHVAIKILFPKWAKDPSALNLMSREAWLLRSMSHPHVVRGLASGHWRGLHWHAMEWVAGPTSLDRLHHGGAFSECSILELARQMGETLRYLWLRGIVHGDIKPANLLLAPGGVAKLCDFGFAQIKLGPGATSGHGAFGTPAYAAPEQQEGIDDLDVRADLFGVGATLYHLASGRMPPSADPWGAAPAMEARLSRELRWLLGRLMAPDRRDRCPGPEALLADVAHLRSLRVRKFRKPVAGPRQVNGEFHWEFN